MSQFTIVDADELDYISAWMTSTEPTFRTKKERRVQAVLAEAYADAAAIMRGEDL